MAVGSGVCEAYKNVDRLRVKHIYVCTAEEYVRTCERKRDGQMETRARYNRDELYLLTDSAVVQLDILFMLSIHLLLFFFFLLLFIIIFQSVHFFFFLLLLFLYTAASTIDSSLFFFLSLRTLYALLSRYEDRSQFTKTNCPDDHHPLFILLFIVRVYSASADARARITPVIIFNYTREDDASCLSCRPFFRVFVL